MFLFDNFEELWGIKYLCGSVCITAKVAALWWYGRIIACMSAMLERLYNL